MTASTWRLLYVRPHGTNAYLAQLAGRSWTGYVPKETVWAGTGPNRKPTDRALLPGYVFVDLTDYQLAEAAHLPGVAYIIRSGDRPADVGGFVKALKDDEARGCFDRTRKDRRQQKRKGKPLKVGERFNVISGAFKGRKGEVVEARRNEATVYLDDFPEVPLTVDYIDISVILEEDVLQKAA
jgi:transcription antitermination factor NusG